MRKIIYLILLLFMGTTSWAGEQVWCVFEPLSSKGDISRRLQDMQSQVQLKFSYFKIEKDAIQAFEQNKCTGLIASNFNTYRYNSFMGSTGGIGLISNNRVARMFLQLMNNPNVEKRMISSKWLCCTNRRKVELF